MTKVFHVVEEFCDRTACDIKLLVGRSREDWIVKQRHAAINACVRCGFRDGDIARFFKRNRTSVVYAKKAWAETVATAKKPLVYDRIIRELNQAAIETSQFFMEE